MQRYKLSVLPIFRRHYFFMVLVPYLVLGIYIMKTPLIPESISDTSNSKSWSGSSSGSFLNSHSINPEQPSPDNTLPENEPPIIPELAYENEMAELEMNQRISRLEEFCSRNKNVQGIIDPLGPHYKSFFWNKEYKVGWCPVYKSGYSSWVTNMMILKGFTESELQHSKREVHDWAREIYRIGYKPEDDEIPYGSKMLIVVRHPFDRLLSAYRDKLEHASESSHYQAQRSEIVSQFRKDSLMTKQDPTFEEFIHFLLSKTNAYGVDLHWLPTCMTCTPCQIKWDFIAKTETYTRDQAYIIRKLGLEGILKPQWQHRHSSSGVTDPKTVALKYYGQLTKKLIKSLAIKFLPDFLLFGYTPEEYILFGKD